jgi:hypothetical protein
MDYRSPLARVLGWGLQNRNFSLVDAASYRSGADSAIFWLIAFLDCALTRLSTNGRLAVVAFEYHLYCGLDSCRFLSCSFGFASSD